MNTQVELSFIVLTWNSERYINDCILSCLKKCKEEEINAEIIIIDNGSNDKTKEIIKSTQVKHDNILTLIELDENRGTTYTRNLGLKKANGTFLCILDSDTEFGEGSLRDCLIKLKNEPQIGILAPRLLLPNGTVQHSVKKFPTFLQKVKKIPKAVFGLTIKDDDFYQDFPFTKEREIDTAISACWFFRKELVKKIGLLDEKIFYAPEDLDYSMRSHKAGKQNIYYPFLTVLHHTQQISHKKPFSKVSLSHLIGLLYYFRKHGGWIRN